MLHGAAYTPPRDLQIRRNLNRPAFGKTPVHRLGKRHVAHPCLEIGQADRRTVSNRINKVFLDTPRAGILRRNRDRLQLGVAAVPAQQDPVRKAD